MPDTRSSTTTKAPATPPLIFAVMGMFAGASDYHEPSAQDARRRIVSFFNTHLKAGEPTTIA